MREKKQHQQKVGFRHLIGELFLLKVNSSLTAIGVLYPGI
ncbi:uncharacterized protein METZ01_LOCUS109078 [marine metagenome]|uniref:Uncharacterized protein n=1 Tax=marine metagenome TaxID=408172 RepID=A0A381WUP9_9ZZZZ